MKVTSKSRTWFVEQSAETNVAQSVTRTSNLKDIGKPSLHVNGHVAYLESDTIVNFVLYLTIIHKYV